MKNIRNVVVIRSNGRRPDRAGPALRPVWPLLGINAEAPAPAELEQGAEPRCTGAPDAVCAFGLSNPQEIGSVRRFLRSFSQGKPLLLLKPSPEGGEIPGEYRRELEALCGQADVLILNAADASAVLGIPRRGGPFSRAYLDFALEQLARLGARKIVLTSIRFDEKYIGAAAYDTETWEMDYLLTEKTAGIDCRAGETFSGSLLAALAGGQPLRKAVRAAVNFTAEEIRRAGRE